MKKILFAGLMIAVSCTASKNSSIPKQGNADKDHSLIVYTTCDKTPLRLTLTDTLTLSPMPQPLETQVCVFIDPQISFQDYIGIGGAITDAAAETFYKLPKDKQEEILTAYYDRQKGIGYTIARTNINSCDFSSDMYTYVKEGDGALTSFDIAHDRKFKIPMIMEAMNRSGNQLKLFASPWSPPAFMKDNNDMLHGGKLKKEFYPSWANYFVKFINAYKSSGIPIWGITIQNEPMAKQTWESCIFTGSEERDFLKNNLGPAMHEAGLQDVKIIGWDHNRDLLYQRARALLSDPVAAKYLWGIGYHWYEPWSGSAPMYDNVKRVHEAFPSKPLLFTEGCSESFNQVRIHDWKLGEMYASSMINDFNNGMSGFTDWNILLDEKGGPNHVGNYCFAPVHADTRTGELTYTNEYFYIGHFSKFIQPGARRIACSSSRSQLLSTAFRNSDGKLVVVVLNQGDAAIEYHLWMAGNAAKLTAKPHSIVTILL